VSNPCASPGNELRRIYMGRSEMDVGI
jgi:hypothetical protein